MEVLSSSSSVWRKQRQQHFQEHLFFSNRLLLSLPPIGADMISSFSLSLSHARTHANGRARNIWSPVLLGVNDQRKERRTAAPGHFCHLFIACAAQHSERGETLLNVTEVKKKNLLMTPRVPYFFYMPQHSLFYCEPCGM